MRISLPVYSATNLTYVPSCDRLVSSDNAVCVDFVGIFIDDQLRSIFCFRRIYENKQPGIILKAD